MPPEAAPPPDSQAKLLARTRQRPKRRWQLPTGRRGCRLLPRVEVAARNRDVLFACFASALRRERVALDGEWPDDVVTAVEQLAADMSAP